MQPRQLWKNQPLTARNAGRRASWAVWPAAALVLAFAAACRFFSVRLSRFVVAGASMEPSLSAGDRLLVVRLPVALLRLRPGCVVTARSPVAPGVEVVKRIAAVASDRGRTTYRLLGD